VTKQAKTVTGIVIVAVVALGAMLVMGLVIGLGIAVVGGLAVVAVLQRTEDGPPRRPRPQRLASRKRDTTTDLLHSATSTVEPLTTWTPPDSLQPWTPPVDDAPAPPSDVQTDVVESPADRDFWAPNTSVTDFSDLAGTDTTEPTSWLDEPATDEQSWADGSTWDDSAVSVDTNPLDELARLDEIDVIAEFERLDEREAPATSMFDVPAPVLEPVTPINEAVSTADDIMAASQATELHVEEDDNSELAKLLAKVQARLAAYE
jgi:hypothetical protein